MSHATSLSRPADPPYLDGLNPVQRQAVEALDGPVLVLAGAGTGKTRVLTTRLVHLIATRRARAGEILALTFTNKAAREMRDRVARLIGHEVEGWWLGTFHSLAARLLRRHAELVGLKPNFTIIDTDDQVRLLKQLMEAEGVDSGKWPARLVLGVIERWKDKALSPGQLKAEDGGDVAGGKVIALYAAYQARLLELNACDFGDLLLHTIRMLQADANLLAMYQDRFRYILVDEYQDTNVAQYLWVRLLAAKHRNLCCVGDDDQSIYSWRGAEVANILKFEADFPGAEIIRLEQNYRSTGAILAAAAGVIAHNRGRLGKTLWTAEPGGEKVRVRGVWDAEEEARWVGDEIEALQRKGESLDEIAILVRAGHQTREFEERFLTIGLPYRIVGGARFYERQEIRDALAYFRVIVSADDDLAFERIVNVPKRGVGPASMQTIVMTARAQRVSMTEAVLRLLETDEFKPKLRATLRQLMSDIARWRTDLPSVPHPALGDIVLEESGYRRMWQADRSPEAPGRVENLKELISALAEFESLPAFLEHVSLVMDQAQADDTSQVTLMTLHAAKGLEFGVVFLPGWEEGIFPSQRAMDETGIAGLEEERRLAYVGLTRARRLAHVSFAANRRIYGSWGPALPSRFVEELPDEATTVERDQGIGGAAEGFEAWNGAGRWEQMRNRVPANRPQLPGTATYEVQTRPRPANPWKAGERVFHQKFGTGTVLYVDNDKLEVEFDAAGTKKVMDSFVTRAAG